MTKKEINFNLSDINNGAVQAKWEKEIKRVAANILDPNTDVKKKRKLVLTTTFSPNADRRTINVDTEIKATLAPQVPASTTIMTGRDINTGEIAVNELKSGVPGQTFIDDDGTVKTDTGTPVEEVERKETTTKKDPNKLVDFQSQKQQQN